MVLLARTEQQARDTVLLNYWQEIFMEITTAVAKVLSRRTVAQSK